MAASARVVRPRHASRPLHRRVIATVAAATAALLGFATVGGATYLQLTTGSIETHNVGSLVGADPHSTKEPDDNSPTDFAANEPINIAIIGSDVRDEVNEAIGGGSDVEGMRSDVTMVMHISADRSRIEVVSIPRDSRVRISDCKMYDGSVVNGWTGKFNIALNNGGQNGNRGEAAACVMRTITDLTGVDFNGHFMMVDFNGFQNMVNAIEGVPMCIPRDMRAPKANLDIKAGPQVFDGETALAFARARTGTGLGDGTDLMRINRQQELLTNTARKVLGMNLFTDVPELTQFVRAGAESLTMDEELGSVSNVVGLAYSLRHFDTRNLTFVTVPWEYATDGTGDVLWKEEEAAAMWQSLVDDVPIVMPGSEATDPDGTDTSPSPTPTPGAIVSPTPPVDPTPTATQAPLRETQEDILASCEF